MVKFAFFMVLSLIFLSRSVKNRDFEEYLVWLGLISPFYAFLGLSSKNVANVFRNLGLVLSDLGIVSFDLNLGL